MVDPIKPASSQAENNYAFIQQTQLKPVQVQKPKPEETQAGPEAAAGVSSAERIRPGDECEKGDEDQAGIADLGPPPADQASLSQSVTQYIEEKQTVPLPAKNVASQPTVPPSYTRPEEVKPVFTLKESDFSDVKFGQVQDGQFLT